MNDLPSVLSTVEVAFSQTLTDSLRAFAISSGWPAEVADMVSVVLYDGEAQVNMLDDSGSEEAFLWEYGTPDRNPTPVVRRWLNRLQSESSEEYFEQVASSILDQVI